MSDRSVSTKSSSKKSNGSAAARTTFADHQAEDLFAVTRSIKKLEGIFKTEFDLDIYLTWGTLLGAVREGDFIAFDTDVDIAYLSEQASDFEITEEHELIVQVLRHAGYQVHENSKGQIHVKVFPDEKTRTSAIFNLDLWTTWVRDDRYYHYPDIKGEILSADVMPLERIEFKGESLWIPSGFDAVLTAFYGPSWRKPDPGYAWYPRYDADDEFEFLRTGRRVQTLPLFPVKTDGLQYEERDGHFYVTGPSVKEEQRLNATGLVILELCTGTNSSEDIVRLLQQHFDLPSAPEVVTLEFISNALRAGLLKTTE